MKTDILEQIGLTKTEARIYLTNLELGPSSAIGLAKKTNLTRQMIYSVLDGLLEKGLIKQVNLGKKNFFKAVDPEILKDKAENVSDQISQLIPILKAKQAENSAVPLISVYENPVAMREWYRQFMAKAKEGEEILSWSTVNDWYSLDTDFYEKFDNYCFENNIKLKLIAPDTPETRKMSNERASSNKEYKFATSSWETKGEKFIWRNQIIYVTMSENATNMIVIESPHLVEIERFDFDRIWHSIANTLH